MTQGQLAKDLNMSVSPISGYEIGDTFPSIESAIKIAKIGNVSLTWLFIGDEKEAQDGLEIGFTPEEKRVLESFRRLSKTSQTAILRIVETMQK